MYSLRGRELAGRPLARHPQSLLLLAPLRPRRSLCRRHPCTLALVNLTPPYCPPHKTRPHRPSTGWAPSRRRLHCALAGRPLLVIPALPLASLTAVPMPLADLAPPSCPSCRLLLAGHLGSCPRGARWRLGVCHRVRARDVFSLVKHIGAGAGNRIRGSGRGRELFPRRAPEPLPP